MSNQRYMNKKEAAEYIGVSVRTIDRLIYAKSIPFAKIGGAVRFDRLDLERWFKSKTTRAG